MHRHPKLILLNGPAGVGKNTIAQAYLADHPLALNAETDLLIAQLGGWLQHENLAWPLAFSLVKSITRAHLLAGYDVIVPFLLLDTKDAEALEAIADETKARFVEIALVTTRDDAIARMFERGSWGEPGSPPLAEADRPLVEQKYDKFAQTLAKRPLAHQITSVKGEVASTYKQVLATINLS